MGNLEGASRAIGAICEQRNSQCPPFHADFAFSAFMSILTKGIIRRVSSLLRRRTRRAKPNSGAESSVQGDTFSPLSPSTAPTSEHVPEHKESKKNFYPVTWRVVGGGVMMSGQRT